MERPRLTRAVLVPMLAIAVLACESTNPAEPSPSVATFRVQACSSQTFQVRVSDPDTIQRATQLIGSEDQPVLLGALARGDGGFNEPWSWHLVPGTIDFADLTTEVCDGCPRMLEQDTGYWVDSVGRFCPWTSRIVGRIN